MRLAVLILLPGCSLYFGSPHASSDAAHGVDASGGDVHGTDPAADATPPPSDGGPGTCGAMTGAGATLVFDSDRDHFNRDLYLIHADGTGLERLTTETSTDREPTVSPDGKTVVFSSNRSGSFQLYAMTLSTGAVVPLTAIAAGAEEPSFSHDGKLLAFRSGTSIYTMHADGTAQTFVIASGLDAFNAYFWPHFSADDSELMFDRNNEIDAVHLDGTGFRYVVSNWTTTIKAPSPSPDGLAVAYETVCADHSIWLTPAQVQTDPCKGRRLTPSDGFEAHRPAWGPSDLIAYERVDAGTGLGQIALISDVSGSTACDVAPDPSDNRDPAWLPGP